MCSSMIHFLQITYHSLYYWDLYDLLSFCLLFAYTRILPVNITHESDK